MTSDDFRPKFYARKGVGLHYTLFGNHLPLFRRLPRPRAPKNWQNLHRVAKLGLESVHSLTNALRGRRTAPVCTVLGAQKRGRFACFALKLTHPRCGPSQPLPAVNRPRFTAPTERTPSSRSVSNGLDCFQAEYCSEYCSEY